MISSYKYINELITIKSKEHIIIQFIITHKQTFYKETVRKIRKLGVENAAEILSTRDKLAALVLICCFNMKEGHYKRKRPASGLYHCHNSVYSEEIYNSSEIVGKERKPGFSRCL